MTALAKTAEDVAAWQRRLGVNGLQAAAMLRIPAQTYRNFLYGRAQLRETTALLMWYIEQYGAPDGSREINEKGSV